MQFASSQSPSPYGGASNDRDGDPNGDSELPMLGHGQRWRVPHQSASNRLFDLLVEYVRLNLFSGGQRHHNRVFVVLAWLQRERRWRSHPGQVYVDTLVSEVGMPFACMRGHHHHHRQ